MIFLCIRKKSVWKKCVWHLFIDLNECGLKPRPCEHRCMNSYGSYKCYCLNGYTLTPDGSCASEYSCATSIMNGKKKKINLAKFAYLYAKCLLLCLYSDSRTCSLAHCQYGCEEVQGEIRCLCPSAGLQLGQDERTCVGEYPPTQKWIVNTLIECH